ncbi:hypothetical protein AVDCRST_MAG81-3157, partial [uncultured Synechococcales cyanobacterium]
GLDNRTTGSSEWKIPPFRGEQECPLTTQVRDGLEDRRCAKSRLNSSSAANSQSAAGDAGNRKYPYL